MTNVRELMRRYAVYPKQSLAQNFLTDPHYLALIAAAADLDVADTVLEIGPGLGSLTHYLAAQAGCVLAVELDDRLIPLLQEQFAQQPQVHIIHADILDLDPGVLIASNRHHGSGEGASDAYANPEATINPVYKVVANLPYYITSAVLRHLLEARHPPARIVVLVQKEVAERICAQPGDLSLLAVSVQFYAQPTLVQRVPAGAFYPAPKVDSAVLRLDRRPTPAAADIPTAMFFQVVRAGFSQKRKQLVNTLSTGLNLPKAKLMPLLEHAGIDPTRRAETLTLEEWGTLCRAYRQSTLA